MALLLKVCAAVGVTATILWLIGRILVSYDLTICMYNDFDNWRNAPLGMAHIREGFGVVAYTYIAVSVILSIGMFFRYVGQRVLSVKRAGDDNVNVT